MMAPQATRTACVWGERQGLGGVGGVDGVRGVALRQHAPLRRWEW